MKWNNHQTGFLKNKDQIVGKTIYYFVFFGNFVIKMSIAIVHISI